MPMGSPFFGVFDLDFLLVKQKIQNAFFERLAGLELAQ